MYFIRFKKYRFWVGKGYTEDTLSRDQQNFNFENDKSIIKKIYNHYSLNLDEEILSLFLKKFVKHQRAKNLGFSDNNIFEMSINLIKDLSTLARSSNQSKYQETCKQPTAYKVCDLASYLQGKLFLKQSCCTAKQH